MAELIEEHNGDDGLLADARNDKDKVTKASASARLKDIKSDRSAADERKVVTEWLALFEKELAIDAKLKAAQDDLTAKVVAKYGKLTVDEIKTLVVDDKWLSVIESTVQGELDRVSHTLTGRVRELAERYSSNLPALSNRATTIANRVGDHLRAMGMQWI
ncbi:MAG: hypothetical protein IPF99_34525 [Deltaproteobacteria bacterium]|nr:hypothetical protein [Deltaproteobacteria bacterium]